MDHKKSQYTTSEIEQAELAQEIQKIIGPPSTCTFLHIADNNWFPNCPAGQKDILAAKDGCLPHHN